MQPASACFDPLDRPCDGPELALQVLTWPSGQPLPEDVAPNLTVEIHGLPPYVALGRPWSLWLEELDPFDLGRVEQILEQAAEAGCRLVVATSVEGEANYRYRLYSLVRLLCDRLKMNFSIFEHRSRPLSDRLNHYLASQRRCCRRLQGSSRTSGTV